MTLDQLFSWVLLAVLVVMLLVSAGFRHRARQATGTVPRRQEGGAMLAARMLVALPLFGGLLLYVLYPPWMTWAQVLLPAWLRWLGVTLVLAAPPLLVWVMRSLGPNVTETVLLKENHNLVTHGPYRRVRHPLYATALLFLVGASLLAANAFIGGMTAVAAAGVVFYIIPREEAALLERFGGAYRAYRQRTGRLLPKFPGEWQV